MASAAPAFRLDPMQLAPGVRRLRPDDHFMILTETEASPMHVGALLMFEVPDSEKAEFRSRFQRQLEERLPGTPLLVRLQRCPDGFDSDVWVEDAVCDLDALVERADPTANLHEDVARRNMQRLDLTTCPFHATVYDALPGERCAVYFKMHHALADGIGFQTILRLLSDATPPSLPRSTGGQLPDDATWHALAAARFAAEAKARDAHSARRKAAGEALKSDPSLARAKTPVLKLSGPTVPLRAYATLSLELQRLRAVAQALGGTVNDIFLALAASTLRRILLDLDDLPDDPIVVNSARSYRSLDHGDFGNRIVAQHPHLATHLADPLERLRAIQASMMIEKRRTGLDEAMLDAPEKPYGARDRRAAFAERTVGGRAVLPGNITLSNVPGPEVRHSFCGYRQVGNFPVPIIGSSRFLNITSRRNGDVLDMGVIVDPTKIPDVDKVARAMNESLEQYERLI